MYNNSQSQLQTVIAKQNINLNNNNNEPRLLNEIPLEFQSIFNFSTFNILQSKIFDFVLYSDEPLVISAPTGSGKTVIFELAIIRLLNNVERKIFKNNVKIVYMAPIKALCAERYSDWEKKFNHFGISCKEVTGDINELDFHNMKNCNIIFTTPEKWDSLTRKWKDNKQLIQMIKLFLIDEVHLLNDDKRGPILEAVVTRMKTIKKNLKCYDRRNGELFYRDLRFLALSATFPNVEDIAQWLGIDENSPAKFIKLNEEFRPVKLKKIVLGYPFPPKKGVFLFEIMLSYKIRQILIEYSEGKPTLIFCSTRKGVIQTCEILIKQVTFQIKEFQKIKLKQQSCLIKEQKLKEYVVAGVGYHHAGMQMEDRRKIEELFKDGLLPVLVTTSTLSMGVNLPAHLVIIKSTSQYNNGCYQDLNEIQLLQMIGRAGRPQYDTSGTAIIMTRDKDKEKYERIVNNQDMIESKLHCHLIDHLNAEIVLNTIKGKNIAMDWLRCTFLYVRALKNPKYYGFNSNLTKKEIENKLKDICMKEMEALEDINLIEMDVNDIAPTQLGKLMSRYYLSFDTMKLFKTLTGSENINCLLNLISSCFEFNDVQLRVNEKRFLNQLNKSKHTETIRFPFKETIKTKQMKISCLIQAVLGNLNITDFSLQQEAQNILRIGQRIANCLIQYLYFKRTFHNLLNIVILSKCFYCKLWENSPYISRQIPKIGATYSKLLSGAGKITFKDILKSNPRDLERILNKPPPFGNILIDYVEQIPEFELNLELIANMKLLVKINVKNNTTIKEKKINKYWLTIIVGNSDGELLLRDRIGDNFIFDSGYHTWTINLKECTNSNMIDAHLIHEQLVGVDCKASIKLNKGLDQFKIHLNNRVKQKNKVSNNLIKDEFMKYSHELIKNSSRRLSSPVIENININNECMNSLKKNNLNYLETQSIYQEQCINTYVNNIDIENENNKEYNSEYSQSFTNDIQKNLTLSPVYWNHNEQINCVVETKKKCQKSDMNNSLIRPIEDYLENIFEDKKMSPIKDINSIQSSQDEFSILSLKNSFEIQIEINESNSNEVHLLNPTEKMEINFLKIIKKHFENQLDIDDNKCIIEQIITFDLERLEMIFKKEFIENLLMKMNRGNLDMCYQNKKEIFLSNIQNLKILFFFKEKLLRKTKNNYTYVIKDDLEKINKLIHWLKTQKDYINNHNNIPYNTFINMNGSLSYNENSTIINNLFSEEDIKESEIKWNYLKDPINSENDSCNNEYEIKGMQSKFESYKNENMYVNDKISNCLDIIENNKLESNVKFNLSYNAKKENNSTDVMTDLMALNQMIYLPHTLSPRNTLFKKAFKTPINESYESINENIINISESIFIENNTHFKELNKIENGKLQENNIWGKDKNIENITSINSSQPLNEDILSSLCRNDSLVENEQNPYTISQKDINSKQDMPNFHNYKDSNKSELSHIFKTNLNFYENKKRNSELNEEILFPYLKKRKY